MKEEMPKEVKNVLIFVIGISLVCLTILILIVFFSQLTNNLGFEQVTFSSSETILSDNGTATTLSEEILLASTDSITATTYNNSWLYCDGYNDGIDEIPSPSGNSNYSWSAWINADSIRTSADNYVLFGGASQRNLKLKYESGILEYTVSNSSGFKNVLTTQNPINDSTWHQIGASINGTGGTMKLYLDGVLKNSTILSGVPNSQLSIIDICNDNGLGYKGNVDEVRIYNIQVEDSIMLEIYNSGIIANSSLPTDGLTFWLPLNEGSGTDVHTFNETDLT